MMVSVNKSTNRKKVEYAALLSGTVSAVWCDDETSLKNAPLRRNRIMLTREKAEQIKNADQYDA